MLDDRTGVIAERTNSSKMRNVDNVKLALQFFRHRTEGIRYAQFDVIREDMRRWVLFVADIKAVDLEFADPVNVREA